MPLAYKRTSHLRQTPIIEGYADLYKPALVPDFERAELFEIKQSHNRRPDLFSYELYGDAQYWWVFALYNRNSITDPINDFTTGKRIYVPERDIIAGIQ